MDADDLYGLALERFVPERSALAKALRGAGERDEAARVAKLGKPTVAAWAVNQLIRTQAAAVAALWQAGDAVREAQDAVLEGRGDARALRDAVAHQRAAAQELVAAARGLLSSEGHELTPATLQRVSDTLHAAALEPEARAQVTDGCLVKELAHTGLGGFGLAGAPTDAPRAGRPPATRQRTTSTPKPDREALRAARQAEQARARERTQARTAEADARRAAQRAQRECDIARAARDRAAQALAEAEEALAQAHERVQRTAAAHREARQRLDELDGN